MTLGLNSALSGLMANSTAISTTSDNIANMETEGYHRKRVLMTTNTQVNNIGSGVRAQSVDRMVNEAAEAQFLYTKSEYHSADTMQNYMGQIDRVIADPTAGLQSTITDFMTAISDAANMPTSDAAKAVLIQKTATLSTQMNALSDFMASTRINVNSQLKGAAEHVNTITADIAEINGTIARTTDTELGALANVLDHRDQLINELSKYTSVNTIYRDDNTVDVMIGNGLSVVSGVQNQQLDIQENEYRNGDISISYSGHEVSNLLQEGMIGGLIEFRDKWHSETENQIGMLSAGIEASYNIQHRQGYTTTGSTNVDFFTPFMHQASASSNNTGAVVMNAAIDYTGSPAAQMANAGLLQPATYEVEKVGANLEFTNTISGVTTSIVESPTMQLDGLEITISGTIPAGDKFLLTPMRSASRGLQPALSIPSDFAQGSVPGGTNSDNTNSLAMADLQSTDLFYAGSTTTQDQFSSIIGNVGAKTFQAEQSAMNASVVMSRIEGDIQSLSGVNMDEEAANLIKYQQAYQALTQVVSTSRELFQTLLSSMR